MFKGLLLDLLNQKLCKMTVLSPAAPESCYSLDDLLNRALPPGFGCFNGILLNLSHRAQRGNLPLFLLK